MAFLVSSASEGKRQEEERDSVCVCGGGCFEKWLRLIGSGFALTKWTPLAAKMHVNIHQTF